MYAADVHDIGRGATVISSRHHPLVARFREAARGGVGTPLLLDGPHLVVEALSAQLPLLDVAISSSRAEDPEMIRCNPAESNAAQWLSWDDALATVDEAPLRQMLKKARRICQGLPSPASGRSTRNTVNPGKH